MSPWATLGLRARLALSFGLLVLASFAIVFVFVNAQMADESRVIDREEAREQTSAPGEGEGPEISPIADAHSDVEQTFLLVGAGALVAALAGGYLLAARTTAPLRRMATTAAEVGEGNLSPRLPVDPGSTTELRTMASAFNQMLDRLDLAFSRQRGFVADASHELRTPMTAIRGQLEVLARGPSPGTEDVRRVEQVALAELRRMERLVDDLLALARFDEGEDLRLAEIEVAEFLGDLAATDPGDLEVTDLCSGQIAVDPDLIARVVRNLLANAHRHAGEQGRVQVSARGSGDRLVIAVDDDGPGIPGEERERVFDRFHRINGARDRSSGGSGLGLSISQAIIETHGGRIWVESSPLGGARVSFELPGFDLG